MKTVSDHAHQPTATNLVINWGNSTLKMGWFTGPVLTQTQQYDSPDALLAQLNNQIPAQVLVSSTSRSEDEIRERLVGLNCKVWVLEGQTPLPIRIELRHIIESYRRERPGIVVLICGSDAPSFESRLKPPIFVVPDLVLIGLNRILRYNVENLQADTPDITL